MQCSFAVKKYPGAVSFPESGLKIAINKWFIDQLCLMGTS